MNVAYTRYMVSDKWRATRKKRLLLDGLRCRTCHATERLEVHHVTYKRFGAEDIENDLITLCHDCHAAITDTIRERKHECKNIRTFNITHEEVSYERTETEDYRNRPTDTA